MSEAKFKTMRHIETVRNYLNWCIRELLARAENHDQTKLQSPEAEAFEKYTERLRGLTYGTPEYYENLKGIEPATKHHYEYNSHHPEHFTQGIDGMSLFDVMEMLCDWKAAGMRHEDGCLIRSINHNKERYGIETQLYHILMNTAEILEAFPVYHRAEDSWKSGSIF